MTGPVTMSIASVADMLTFGRRLATQIRRGDMIALSGNLGAGKTVLARGVLEGLDEARVKRAEASGGSGEVILDALGMDGGALAGPAPSSRGPPRRR